ncbi:hypothetical protein [uncultured Ruminococcus sp.]|uniref:hypothetical protein n=1 Tax=uncultured Ruminococcus sp. TaxID=165186 RepID=UPI00260E4762|nr:hypothetical protein [uncultured Ruminococcus sp.]
MDKKLKEAADKIKMPEDMKERIIKACEESAGNRITRENHDDDFTEVVSGTERVSSRSRMIRMVSALAACAVLVGGIGATGALLHKQNRSHLVDSELVQSTNAESPFGDFSTFEFRFDAGDGKYGKYSAETYARLADCLNRFDWGEELVEYETRTGDQDAEGQMYDIKWTNGDTPPVECNIHIANDGFVTYQESMLDPESGTVKTIGSKCYKIDFDAFDSQVQEILSQNSDTVSPFGDFRTFDFEFQKGSVRYTKNSGEPYNRVADFLNNFNWGEEISPQDGRENPFEQTDSEVEISWDIDGDVHWIHIAGDGYVIYSADDYDEDYLHSKEIERRYYSIDYESFLGELRETIGIDCYISNEEVELLRNGDLISADLRVPDDNGGDIIIAPESQDDKDVVEDFLRNDFISMLKVNNIDENEFDLRYSVVFMFRETADTLIRKTFYVHGNGYVSLCEYEVTNQEEVPTGCENYSVDFEEFEASLQKLGIDTDKAKNEVNENAPEKHDTTAYSRIVEFLNSHDDGGLVVWIDENGGWNKQDLNTDQFDTVRDYFNDNEFGEIVPNTFGQIESKKWNEEFGLSQIQLYDSEADEHIIIYVSRDSSLIAVQRSSNTTTRDEVTIYSAEGLEALQFIRDYAE